MPEDKSGQDQKRKKRKKKWALSWAKGQWYGSWSVKDHRNVEQDNTAGSPLSKWHCGPITITVKRSTFLWAIQKKAAIFMNSARPKVAAREFIAVIGRRVWCTISRRTALCQWVSAPSQLDVNDTALLLLQLLHA